MRTVMTALREVIEREGLSCALYSDRASHFFVTPKAGEAVVKSRLTQVGRALKELGVTMIPAYSPVQGAGLVAKGGYIRLSSTSPDSPARPGPDN